MNKFSKKYGSTYKCKCCDHQTRETGEGESDLRLCAPCFHVAGEENSFNDGHIDEVQYFDFLFDIANRYGLTGERVKRVTGYTLEELASK